MKPGDKVIVFIAKGDREAVEEFIRLNDGDIRRMVTSLLRNSRLAPENADDIMQQVYEALWQRVLKDALTLNDDKPLVAYAKGVAVNKFKDFRRRIGRRNERPTGETETRIRDHRPSPEVQLIQRARIHERMAAWSVRTRRIVILDALGFSDKEIAARENMPVGSVKSVLFRFRDKGDS